MALVAARTHNAVAILDDRGLIEWANEGFGRTTGLCGRRGDRPAARPRCSASRPPTARRWRRPWRGPSPGRNVGSTSRLTTQGEGRRFWAEYEGQPVADRRAGRGRHHRPAQRRVRAPSRVEPDRGAARHHPHPGRGRLAGRAARPDDDRRRGPEPDVRRGRVLGPRPRGRVCSARSTTGGMRATWRLVVRRPVAERSNSAAARASPAASLGRRGAGLGPRPRPTTPGSTAGNWPESAGLRHGFGFPVIDSTGMIGVVTLLSRQEPAADDRPAPRPGDDRPPARLVQRPEAGRGGPPRERARGSAGSPTRRRS